ncbi:MAG: hypothetical protein AAFY34_11235 [Pseudomonadota bacterium]
MRLIEWRSLFAAACLLSACGAQDAADAPLPRPAPDQTLIELPVQSEPPLLTDLAEAQREALRDLAIAGRLRGLSRLADRTEGFISNFAGEAHYDHWQLLRRTGVDPLAKLVALLDEPHAERQVGDEVWYVWPDLAVLSSDALVPERLAFQDRARLLELVGEEGVARIRAGEDYPGFRTAIADTGRWVYFLHETGDEVTE